MKPGWAHGSEGGRTRSDKPFVVMSEHAPRHTVKKALRDGTPIELRGIASWPEGQGE